MSRPNPYVDSKPWGRIEIGGLVVPGVVVSVDGAEKPEEWSVQKGSAQSNATSTWKGTKLAESIKIATKLPDADSFDRWYDMRDTLRPKLGEKPPNLPVVNPIINFNGIVRVGIKTIGAPKWETSGGYWSGQIELTELEDPKPANTGSAEKKILYNEGPSGADLDPNQDKKDELQEYLNQGASL